MSARPQVVSSELFESPDLAAVEREDVGAEISTRQSRTGWNPESFAREQIQGLVRRVFFSNAARAVRQVLFCAVEPETEVRSICRRVGEALALEAAGPIAVVRRSPRLLQEPERIAEVGARPSNLPPLQRAGTRVRGNLWQVPALGSEGGPVTNATLHAYLGELRREFEYSIVEAAAVSESNETMAMAQFADGIVLVLSAQHSRRVTARKIKDGLEGSQARLLGIVLSDRLFPIPAGIYRRL